jgi:hypothetical protein
LYHLLFSLARDDNTLHELAIKNKYLTRFLLGNNAQLNCAYEYGVGNFEVLLMIESKPKIVKHTCAVPGFMNYRQATGKLNVKEEPRPGALSASTCPP